MYVFGMLFFYSMFSYCVKARTDHGFLESNPFQYLEEHQYLYENHTVITEDGYRLLLVRILYNKKESPSNTKRPPILFVHGIFSSFIDFLATGPQKALGFKALEQGYDVFLVNVRGNRWSRSHMTLDPDKDVTKFWNFSWHQIGMYDLPATIDYIRNVTAYSKISYVGFSQGCTSFLVMTSTRPEYNRVIRIAVLLSPVSFLGDAQFIFFKIFKHMIGFLQVVQEAFHIHEVLPYNPTLARTLQFLCGPQSILLPICKRIFYELVGPSTQIYDSALYVLFAHFPVGASINQVLHYLQNSKSKEFRLYDYGKNGNMLQYGQPVPPNYDLSEISAPLALYYSADDYFLALSDEKMLAKKLPNIVENVLVPYNKTNHFDIVLGKMAEDLFTKPALTVINKFNNF